jgi:hypothetical protein
LPQKVLFNNLISNQITLGVILNTIYRRATEKDYQSFYEIELLTWRDTGLEPIPKDIFCSWINTHPEGFLLAVNSDTGSVVGHIYSQICDFDPDSKLEQRSYDQITGGGSTVSTHDINGSALYIVSVSATAPGVGKKLIRMAIDLTVQLQKKFCVGSCRLSGLARYIKTEKPCRAEVEHYVELVCKTVSRRLDSSEKRVLDPVLTPFLSIEGMVLYGLINDFSNDKESFGWACTIAWKNIHCTGI